MKFQDHLGLDIGSSSVRLVQLTPAKENRFTLLSYGEIAIPVAVGPDQAEADAKMTEAIKKLLAETKVTSRRVVVGLPESQVYTRVIEMPVLAEPDLTQAIHWQAEQYIPVPLSDVVLKHQVLSQNENGKMSVLLLAAPNNLLNRYTFFLSQAGLETMAIETEILAVARAIVGLDAPSPATLLVNIGSASTTLAIVSDGNLILTQSVPTGGEAITRTISSNLGLEFNQAEQYKKAYGLDATKIEGKVATTIKPVINLIVAEVKRALAYFDTRGEGKAIKRVVLSGGSAGLPDLVPYLSLSLNLEVQLGDPLSAVVFTSESQKQEMGEKAPSFAAAIGLAMKPV